MTGPRTLLPTTLDVFEVAHLAGGPERVADTAVVALLGRGLLQVDPAGRLQAVGRPGSHPVEAAALDAAGPRPRWSATTVRRRVAEDPRVLAVGERLAAEGLLRRNPLAWLRESWPRLLRTGAGRRVLDQWAAERAAGGGTEAGAVALHGTAGMADRVLHESVFGPPPGRPAPRARDGVPRYADGHGSSTAYLGWGYAGGDGGWSGGGWGGDGGCGGGDGGGC